MGKNTVMVERDTTGRAQHTFHRVLWTRQCPLLARKDMNILLSRSEMISDFVYIILGLKGSTNVSNMF